MTHPEAIAAAIAAGATTTQQIAAACDVPHDDALFRAIARMYTDGWFRKVPTGPGTYRLDLAVNPWADDNADREGDR